VSTHRSLSALALAAAASVVLSGCGDLSSDDVTRTARAFAGAEDDPAARCSLLADQTLSALVENEGATCEDAVQDLPLGSGEIVSVDVWGQEAQVKLSDDTLFLTLTRDGWRVTAAACRAQGSDQPYACQVEA
jgi:hypothetical protein